MPALTRIYTRTGDDGSTSDGSGQRIEKIHPRVVAGGSIDETNCAIGVAVAADELSTMNEDLRRLQHFLFDLGADVCVPLKQEPASSTIRIQSSHVVALERMIDSYNEKLKSLKNFVLPGGSTQAAALHLSRSICRRAELDLLQLSQLESINPHVIIAMNRLSDLLFVLARTANTPRGDVLWQPDMKLELHSADGTRHDMQPRD
ncbi:MAG: cob(I)yrinic acid a,c-diamide adenosyltransferase [Planctomycetaceae bacterium]